MASSDQLSTSPEALSLNPAEQVRASIIDRLSVLQMPEEVVERVMASQRGISFEVATTQPEDHSELLIRPSVSKDGTAYVVDSRLVDYRHGKTLLGEWTHGDVDADRAYNVNVRGLCEQIGKAYSVRINLPAPD